MSVINNKWSIVNGVLRNDNKIQNHIYPSVGNGLKFDGVNDYVDLTNNALLNFGLTSEFTISSWFNANSFALTNSTSPRLFTRNTTVPFFGYNALVNDTVLGFIFYSNGNSLFLSTSFAFSINTLYHVALVKRVGLTASDISIYINGVSQSISLSGSLGGDFTSNASAKIGKFGTDSEGLFNGKIYDLKIFNKALTQDEVTTLYNSNNNLIPNSAYPNLVANYTFNQKQGISLTDSSGNNYHGNLINYATPSDVTPSATNSWVDENGNPILV